MVSCSMTALWILPIDVYLLSYCTGETKITYKQNHHFLATHTVYYGNFYFGAKMLYGNVLMLYRNVFVDPIVINSLPVRTY